MLEKRGCIWKLKLTKKKEDAEGENQADEKVKVKNNSQQQRKFNQVKIESRALRIYNNLKKEKQPISLGWRLMNFLNSLFTPGNIKKSKSTTSLGGYEDLNIERKSKSEQASISACSSAPSFSCSCLRHKLRDGVQKSVCFYPVSVIFDEENRPYGHKFLYEQNDDSIMMPMSVPTMWKIIRQSPPTNKKNDGEIKSAAIEKSKRVEEVGRKLPKEYLQNHMDGFTVEDKWVWR